MPLINATDTEIVYGRTDRDRWASGVVGAIMLAISTVPPIMFISAMPRSEGYSPQELEIRICGGLPFEMMGLFIFLFFLVTEDLILDLKTRTYRYRSGLPLLTRWRTGPFSDIEDIVLRKASTRQGIAYRVVFKWREPAPGLGRSMLRGVRDYILDQYGPKPHAAAVRELDMVVRRLALPGILGHD